MEFVHSHNVDKESTLAISSDEALDPSLLPSGCTPTWLVGGSYREVIEEVARRAGHRSVTVLCDTDKYMAHEEDAVRAFCDDRDGWSWADGRCIHGCEDQVIVVVYFPPQKQLVKHVTNGTQKLVAKD